MALSHKTLPDACAELQVLARVGRRQLLQAGSLGLLGLGAADLFRGRLRASESSSSAGLPGFGKAKSCIFLFMWGGPSQLETFDPKPEAPSDIRGEFRPISTRVPGIEIS